MTDIKTTDEIRRVYSFAYAWRSEDSEGQTDLSSLRQSNTAEFTAWLARQPPEPVVDPDICGVCGRHNLTNGEYAMSHERFVEFGEWAKRQPYARDHQRESVGPTDDQA